MKLQIPAPHVPRQRSTDFTILFLFSKKSAIERLEPMLKTESKEN